MSEGIIKCYEDLICLSGTIINLQGSLTAVFPREEQFMVLQLTAARNKTGRGTAGTCGAGS